MDDGRQHHHHHQVAHEPQRHVDGRRGMPDGQAEPVDTVAANVVRVPENMPAAPVGKTVGQALRPLVPRAARQEMDGPIARERKQIPQDVWHEQRAETFLQLSEPYGRTPPFHPTKEQKTREKEKQGDSQRRRNVGEERAHQLIAVHPRERPAPHGGPVDFLGQAETVNEDDGHSQGETQPRDDVALQTPGFCVRQVSLSFHRIHPCLHP